MSRFGTIALAARPNAGKSTLFNALVGERLAITSPKPQTTRLPVIGIRSEDDVQLVFVDLPGLLEPTYPLHDAMLEAAHDSLAQTDAILYLHPADETPWPERAPLERANTPIVLVISKSDRVPPAHRPSPSPSAIVVSAVTGEGVDALLTWCRAQAREGPFRYDPDDTSSQPVRFFASELVREAAFEHLGEELPYALAVEIDEFREHSDPVYIRATIYVERDSQKAMVVGKGGRMVKTIGEQARTSIEGLLDRRAYLDLWVKTLPNWRHRADVLKRLGFFLPPSSRRA